MNIFVTIKKCARCGQDHENLMFSAFQVPIKPTEWLTYPFWAMCPINEEPIMMAIRKPATGVIK